MKQPWTVQRRTTPQPDGQRRWDLAYQRLLSWAQEPARPASEPVATNQEERDESSHLRAGLDATPSAKPEPGGAT